jgi:UDP-glucose:glycoprotein glucosyltransferase
LEDDAAFFPLVGLLSDPVDRRLDTPANTYETALAQVANYGLPAASIDTLTLGIANREATPRLQAFYETYAALRLAPPAGCTSFVVYSADASLTCDPAAILASFEEGSIAKASAALPFEHATRSVADAQPIYTLYGDPTDSDFHSLHTQLYQASQRNAIQYRLRWKPPAGHDTARKLPITGYGAGLDIKKSDYLAVDDRQMVNQTGKTVRTEGQEEVRFGEESIELDSLAPLTRAELFGQSCLRPKFSGPICGCRTWRESR